MKIFLGADHRGFALKEAIKAWLVGEGYEVQDLGASTEDEQDDYPDYAAVVGKAVIAEEKSTGILFCGSGAGVAVAANKIKGIRAALIHDAAIAQAARHDDNLNVLALGADYIGQQEARKVILTWLTTPYVDQSRYQRRIDKITELES